jgi:hypothetical protein
MGRRNLIGVAMLGSALLAATIGYFGSLSYSIAVAMMILYGFIVWLDSSSLTAGAAGTADPARRGAQLAVHSSLGYAAVRGAFDHRLHTRPWRGMSRLSWSLAFSSVAVLMLIALVTFLVIRPRELVGTAAPVECRIRSGRPEIRRLVSMTGQHRSQEKESNEGGQPAHHPAHRIGHGYLMLVITFSFPSWTNSNWTFCRSSVLEHLLVFDVEGHGHGGPVCALDRFVIQGHGAFGGVDFLDHTASFVDRALSGFAAVLLHLHCLHVHAFLHVHILHLGLHGEGGADRENQNGD